jgi:TetR/AcrR family transcriptional repressor of nem operon
MRSKDFDEDEILRKAINIFWEKGYYATSIHDLIAGLGIGRSSIYHTFGDKHNLFIKALELYQSVGTQKIAEILESAPSVKIALENLFNDLIEDIFNGACSRGCFKVNTEVEVAAHDEMVHKMVHDDDLLIENTFFQLLKKGQQNGELNSSKDPMALSRFFCSTVAGMRVYAKFRKDRQFFEDVAKTALSVIA